MFVKDTLPILKTLLLWVTTLLFCHCCYGMSYYEVNLTTAQQITIQCTEEEITQQNSTAELTYIHLEKLTYEIECNKPRINCNKSKVYAPYKNKLMIDYLCTDHTSFLAHRREPMSSQFRDCEKKQADYCEVDLQLDEDFYCLKESPIDEDCRQVNTRVYYQCLQFKTGQCNDSVINCSGKGDCINRTDSHYSCLCSNATTGYDCEIDLEECMQCKYYYHCAKSGFCVCNDDINDLNCELYMCDEETDCRTKERMCAGEGGGCLCNPERKPITNAPALDGQCSRRNCIHGTCIHGRCICNNGMTGKHCEYDLCYNKCNPQQRCVYGVCQCKVGKGQDPDCKPKVLESDLSRLKVPIIILIISIVSSILVIVTCFCCIYHCQTGTEHTVTLRDRFERTAVYNRLLILTSTIFRRRDEPPSESRVLAAVPDDSEESKIIDPGRASGPVVIRSSNSVSYSALKTSSSTDCEMIVKTSRGSSSNGELIGGATGGKANDRNHHKAEVKKRSRQIMD